MAHALQERVCNVCREAKPLSSYGARSNRPLGLQYTCKGCLAERARERRVTVSLTEEQKERARQVSSKWRKQNPDRNRDMKASWRMRNLHKKNSSNSYRRALKLERTPSWLTEEHKQSIRFMYWLARDLGTITGESYHVDHIVPLQGCNVCGLHVPWNLQVLPSDLNIKKGNSFYE